MIRNKAITNFATRVYRISFPNLLSLGSLPEYFLKYRRYRADESVRIGFSDHANQQIKTPDEVLYRIIKAYNKAKLDQKKVSGPYQVGHLWQGILDTQFIKLTTAIHNNDISNIQKILENFNREDCGRYSVGGAEFYCRIGHVPFYRYQFINSWYKRYEVCKRIMSSDPKLSYPLVGNPVGIYRMGQTIPISHIEYYCYADEINSLINKIANPVICEIGGGVGGQAYEVIRNGTPNLIYIILDIPEVLLLSSYFLMMAFPNKSFQLYGEESNNANIKLLPNFTMPELLNNSVDLFFNSCSLSEMDYATGEEYLRQIERICKTYLLHINHDAKITWYEGNDKITNMIGSEFVPESFDLIYKEPRLFSLIEDTFVIRWFYQAGHYKYLYKKPVVVNEI